MQRGKQLKHGIGYFARERADLRSEWGNPPIKGYGHQVYPYCTSDGDMAYTAKPKQKGCGGKVAIRFLLMWYGKFNNAGKRLQ